MIIRYWTGFRAVLPDACYQRSQGTTARDYRPASTRNPPPKLLDDVRQVLRLHHYSMHTERSSVEWIVRFIRFHRMRSREDLFSAEPKIESFLTDLAVHRNVAAATQNQARPCMPWCSSPSASSTTPWRAASMPCVPTRRATSPWS